MTLQTDDTKHRLVISAWREEFMAASAHTYKRISYDRHLVRYFREISKFQPLDAGEEHALAKRWRENHDREAADRLVTSHLRLVVKVALGFRGYGLPISDLIAEGNIGMMRAVDGFDPCRGVRLSTYAVWWIRAAIQQYILHNWSLVRISTTAAQKKLFFRLRRTKELVNAIEGGDLSQEHVRRIASWLNVPTKEVVSMNRRLAAPDSSLNAPLGPEGEGQWQDWLIDDTPSQEIQLAEHEEHTKRRQALSQGLAALSTRERHIVVERHLKEKPATLDVLGRAHGVSDERIRQIEVIALKKLKMAIRGGAADHQLLPRRMVPLLQHGAAGSRGGKARVREAWRVARRDLAADAAGRPQVGTLEQADLPDSVGHRGEGGCGLQPAPQASGLPG